MLVVVVEGGEQRRRRTSREGVGMQTVQRFVSSNVYISDEDTNCNNLGVRYNL